MTDVLERWEKLSPLDGAGFAVAFWRNARAAAWHQFLEFGLVALGEPVADEMLAAMDAGIRAGMDEAVKGLAEVECPSCGQHLVNPNIFVQDNGG